MGFKVGDYVKTFFDTGAMGATVLYGQVVQAGPKAYKVRWESGLTNRLKQDYPYIQPADDLETAREACAIR